MNKLRVIGVLALLLVLQYPLAVHSGEPGFEALTLSTSSPITVDGDPSDWGTFNCPSLPIDGNYGVYYYTTINGVQQWIWCDAIGDERTDFANPDKRVDLVQFRITGDEEFIYMLFIFNDMSGFYIGDNGGTFIAVTINVNGPGVNEWFAGLSETTVHDDAKWKYQVVVNLADSRYSGQGKRSIIDTLHANWGAIFYLVDEGWSFKTDVRAQVGVNLDYNAVEIKIPWEIIGVPSGPVYYLRLSLITARGWSDYERNLGNTWDISGQSDALDAMTTAGPNTWDEVHDGRVDYYADVYFTTTPPYVPIPEPWFTSIAVASVTAGSIGLGTILKKRKNKNEKPE